MNLLIIVLSIFVLVVIIILFLFYKNPTPDECYEVLEYHWKSGREIRETLETRTMRRVSGVGTYEALSTLVENGFAELKKTTFNEGKPTEYIQHWYMRTTKSR